MDLPYTKEEVVKNDFLFVSYKHEDTEIVVEVIGFLVEQGIRIWYDADLVYGDKWPEIAEKLIKNDHCRGVIFFNSKDSFQSNPVYLERGFALEKSEMCKRKGQPFLILPINIGKPSTMLLLKSVFDSLPENDKEIERVFPLEYLKGITALFSSDTIYCYADPENRIEYKEKLADNIKKAFPSVVDHKALSVKQIEKSLGTAKTTVSLGICKGKTSDALPGYFLTKDQRIDYQGSTYLVENGIAYETQKILWRPVYCDDEYFVLLSQNIVDIRNGGDDLKKWLTDVFFKLSFEDDEKEAIKTVKLLSEEDISKSQTDDILSFPDSDTHWWLDARNSGALQKVVKKDGTVYQSGYNFRTKKSGVRPVICIKKDYIASLNG